jgi:hypothetical protein
MINPKMLPENIRKCMPLEQRRILVVPTLSEAEEKAARREELKLHDQFVNWCRLNGIPYIHARPDRKSTIAKGHPDFTLLWHGRGCCIEFKAGKGKVTQDQAEKIKELDEARVPCLVTTSLVFAIEFAKEVFGLTPDS